VARPGPASQSIGFFKEFFWPLFFEVTFSFPLLSFLGLVGDIL